MKTMLNLSVLTFLLVAGSSQCFAEIVIRDVSKAKAKEMGVTIRSHKNGDAGVMVRLEFKAQGVLKDFNRVELIIRANSHLGAKRLVSAPLLAERPVVDSVSAHFSAAPSHLAASELWIVVNDPPLGGAAYRFQVKDFLEREGAAPSIDKPFERDSVSGAVGTRTEVSKDETGPETPPGSLGRPGTPSSGANTVHPVGGELLPETSVSKTFSLRHRLASEMADDLTGNERCKSGAEHGNTGNSLIHRHFQRITFYNSGVGFPSSAAV